MINSTLEQKVFLALLLVVSIAFGWILLPFYGAVFWAVILAIIFAPVQRRLYNRVGHRQNLAALITLSICLLVAVLPVIFITGMLVQEGSTLYEQIESGELDIGSFVSGVKDLLPPALQTQLQRFGFDDWEQIRERLSSGALQGSQFLATKAFSFGQGTFQFVLSFFLMLYLLFFLIRDGRELVIRIRLAIPLSDTQKRRLFSKFTRVVRATVKGNIVVAVTQGDCRGSDSGCIRRDYLCDTRDPQCRVVGRLDVLSFVTACGGRRRDLGARGDLLPDERPHHAGRYSYPVRCTGDRSGRQYLAAHPGRKGHQNAGLRRADFYIGWVESVWAEWIRYRATDCSLVYIVMGTVHFP